MAQASSKRIVRMPELLRRYGNPSRDTIWRWVKAGRLPAPVEFGPNTVGWWEDELEEHDKSLPRRTYAAELAAS